MEHYVLHYSDHRSAFSLSTAYNDRVVKFSQYVAWEPLVYLRHSVVHGVSNGALDWGVEHCTFVSVRADVELAPHRRCSIAVGLHHFNRLENPRLQLGEH